MKIRIISYLSLFLINTMLAQAPTIDWQNTIGGTGSDLLHSLQQTSDGGYIIAGQSNSNISGDKTENSQGNTDYWVVKLNSVGSIAWQNTIGGSDQDDLFSVIQTSDGGYLLGGYSNSGVSGDKTEATNGWSDFWVVKLNSVGSIAWQNSIGGGNTDALYAIDEISTGGYILAGESQSLTSGDKTEDSYEQDGWVVKINSDGSVAWDNTIRGYNQDWFKAVQVTSDGGFILGGYSNGVAGIDKTENSNGGGDYFIVKLNSDGSIAWDVSIGGSGEDYLECIKQTSDGGYIAGGVSHSPADGDKSEGWTGSVFNHDIWVVRLNSTGGIIWENTIGGNSNDWLMSIEETADGGFLLGGSSLSGATGDKTEASRGGGDFWIIKLHPDGNIYWQKTIGGDLFDGHVRAHQTSDGGYILGGESFSNLSGDKSEGHVGNGDYWVVKLNADEPLPVELTSFSVENTINGVLCKWITESEIENLGFLLERRTRDTDWMEIASYKTDYNLLGQGTTSIPHEYEYIDKFIKPNTTYEYRLSDVDYNGVITTHSSRKILVSKTPLSSTIDKFNILPAYPNPFNPITTITYGLNKDSKVTVSIYDITGNIITTLLNMDQEQGWHSIEWNGTDINNKQVPAGVYIGRVTSNEESQTIKLMLLK